MKALLIVLILFAAGLGVLALRKESVVAIDSYSVLVDGSKSQVVSSKYNGSATIDLKPYAKIGLVLDSVVIIGLAVALRKKKGPTSR